MDKISSISNIFGFKRALIFGVAIMSIAVISGCSASIPESTNLNNNTVEIARPTLAADDPYGTYLGMDLLNINSAINASQYNCYADNGYPQFLEVLPEQKADSFRSIADTPDFPTAFASFTDSPWFSSEEQAKSLGFGKTSSPTERSVVVMDTSFPSVMADCRKSVLEDLGVNATIINQYIQLGNTLVDTIVAAGSIQPALDSRIFDCLEKRGYPLDRGGANIDPTWGVDFGIALGSVVSPPFPDLTKQGSIAVVPASSETYTPTAEESKMAGDMYKCSVETGSKTEWEKNILNAKNTVLNSNETALTELNPEIRSLAAKVSAALAGK